MCLQCEQCCLVSAAGLSEVLCQGVPAPSVGYGGTGEQVNQSFLLHQAGSSSFAFLVAESLYKKPKE